MSEDRTVMTDPKQTAGLPADHVEIDGMLEPLGDEAIDTALMKLQSVTLKRLHFRIATKPGPERCAGWWATTLSRHFSILSFEDDGEHIRGEAEPLSLVLLPEPRQAVGNAERLVQVKINCAKTPMRILEDGEERIKLPDNGRRAHLLCAGPSLAATYEEAIREFDAGEADIFTVSVAHAFLAQHDQLGKVMAHIDADPREHKGKQIGPADWRVEYWLASCVHPTYVDKCIAAGAVTKLWHAYNGEESYEALAIPSERRQRMVIGGGSIGLRAMSLLYYLGYRDQVIHGMDCSYSSDGDHHVAEHLGKHAEGTDIFMGGRWFKTTAALIIYAKYAQKQLSWMPDCKIAFRGDGFLSHFVEMRRAA